MPQMAVTPAAIVAKAHAIPIKDALLFSIIWLRRDVAGSVVASASIEATISTVDVVSVRKTTDVSVSWMRFMKAFFE